MKNDKFAFPGKRVVSKDVQWDEKSGQNIFREITENLPGMTLREYYAGQALAGMLAGGANWHEEKTTATIATKHADALIAELEGGEHE